MILLLGVAAGIALGANLWKRDLRVAHVRIQGNKIVAEKELLGLAGISKDEKLFDVDLFAARQRLQQNRFIKSASVNRETPDGISITIMERIPIAAMVLDRILYLDADGMVLPPVRSDEVLDLPLVTGDLPAAECVPGKQITSKNVHEVLEMLTTARTIGEELYHRISEIRLDGDRDIVFFTTESGIPVVFGHGDAAMKLVKFDGFWKQIVTQRGAGDLKTVDLRYADQVVVRWQSDENTAVQ